MRGTKVQGRFKIDYENLSINEGIVDELRDPVGSVVGWWLWDDNALASDYGSFVDPIYDVSNQNLAKGRRWKNPFDLPVIMAQQIRGTNVMNERGFYTVDTLRLVVSVADVQRLIPAMMTDPNVHIKDRINFQNGVFTPTRVLPRGRYANNYAVVTIDCNQVNSEELVNDPQFNGTFPPSSSTNDYSPIVRTDGYGEGDFGSETYGK
jgi:hypothetical protein